MSPVLWALSLLAATFVLLATLVALVLGRKLSRDRREHASSGRRARFAGVVRYGSPAATLVMMREVARSARAQLDLVIAIDLAGPRHHPARLERLHRAAHAAGLVEHAEAMRGSRTPIVRGRAALVLGRLRLPGGEVLLAPLLADRDADVRLAAVTAIAMAETPEAADALVGALCAGLVTPERIIERLAGRWSVDVLLDALDRPATQGEGRSSPRVSIARALGLAGDLRAEPALERLLGDGSDEERVSAARALGQLGTPDAREALTAALDPGFGWPLRAQAAKALGEIGDPRSAPELEAMLGDQAWWVRANAANALRRLGADGIAALERATDHPDRYARDRAREALALEGVAAARREEAVAA